MDGTNLPAVMSNVEAYRDVVRRDETGILVENTTEAWLGALCRLVQDAAWREELRRNAQQDVLAHHTLAAQAEERRQLWREILSAEPA